MRNFQLMPLSTSSASAVRARVLSMAAAAVAVAACASPARDGQRDARNATLPTGAADPAGAGGRVSREAADGGPGGDLSSGCERDDDCVRVMKGCCNLGEYVAVTKKRASAYQSSLSCERVSCPMILVADDHSVAQCNAQTHACEVVLPGDIECNGSGRNPHACPDGWRCTHDGPSADQPGRCVQRCGGLAGIPCASPDERCVDDPEDGCDPGGGGADCGGLCMVPAE